jgi:hypothetical protein
MRTKRRLAVITDTSQGIGVDGLTNVLQMSKPPWTLCGDGAVSLAAWMALHHDTRSYALVALAFGKAGHFAARKRPEIWPPSHGRRSGRCAHHTTLFPREYAA